MARSAIILGIDTQDGAYLARLLLARGYRLWAAGESLAAVERLGIAGSIEHRTTIDRALIREAAPGEVYDLRTPGPGRVEAIRTLLDVLGPQRLFSAGSSIPGAASAVIAAARDAGRFAVTGHLFARESRLSPGTSFVARIVAAAAAGTEPRDDDLAAVADCGWTPEYVDAMWRMLQRANPADFVLATGHALGGHEVARHAFAYFGHDARRFGGSAPAAAAVGDPGPARADLGWSATTWGCDLVRTLCDGVAEERGAGARARTG